MIQQPRAPTGASVALAVALAVVAAATVRWRSRAVHIPRLGGMGEPWEHIKDDYPLLAEPSEPPELSATVFDAVLHANPFSPTRRPVDAADGENQPLAEGPAASAPITPEFLYKGHIDLGKRQRAIVEETTTGKTYFLEVGQEVAGFKVLDISQTSVVLSDLKTAQQIVIMRKAAGEPEAGDAGK